MFSAEKELFSETSLFPRGVADKGGIQKSYQVTDRSKS